MIDFTQGQYYVKNPYTPLIIPPGAPSAPLIPDMPNLIPDIASPFNGVSTLVTTPIHTFVPAPLDILPKVGVKPMTNGYTTQVATATQQTGLIPDLFGLSSTGLGLNIPTACLAYGAHSMFIKKRRGLMPIAALLYGAYGTGILQGLFPGQTAGQTGVNLAMAGILPTGIGTAAVAGLGPAMLLFLGKALFSGRSRRRTSYRRSYSRPRRFYNRSRRRY